MSFAELIEFLDWVQIQLDGLIQQLNRGLAFGAGEREQLYHRRDQCERALILARQTLRSSA